MTKDADTRNEDKNISSHPARATDPVQALFRPKSKFHSQTKCKKWSDDVDKMHEALRREGIGSTVMEIFSPTRVNGMASRLGIIPGMSLDLTTSDPDDGMPWDFNDPQKRTKALDMVLGKAALLVIGSPMCKAFSRGLQSWLPPSSLPPRRFPLHNTSGLVLY